MKSAGEWAIVVSVFACFVFPVFASEVLEETSAQVLVREHPKTGRPYVSIVALGEAQADPFLKLRTKMKRPDYRMLDPNVKSGEIPYDGPYSDAKRVYLFAASLATLGTVGGALAIAAIPASAGGAASGGGAFLAAGSAVALGGAGSPYLAAKSDHRPDDYIQISKSRVLPSDVQKNLETEKK
ncbi:MAG: hypothetical protein HY588_00525 [Candidatus Omnitrophica bacterium]|nr:hypothetical protein [Candidatus Omnitrophota bacterium]